MLTRKIGIDLGTANTVVFVPGRGFIINEPTIVALTRPGNVVLAVGAEAKEMIGRTPDLLRHAGTDATALDLLSAMRHDGRWTGETRFRRKDDTRGVCDTVVVPRNGSVAFRSRFLDYTGVYMLHCHMMNHEEMGMMQTVEVYK